MIGEAVGDGGITDLTALEDEVGVVDTDVEDLGGRLELCVVDVLEGIEDETVEDKTRRASQKMFALKFVTRASTLRLKG